MKSLWKFRNTWISLGKICLHAKLYSERGTKYEQSEDELFNFVANILFLVHRNSRRRNCNSKYDSADKYFGNTCICKYFTMHFSTDFPTDTLGQTHYNFTTQLAIRAITVPWFLLLKPHKVIIEFGIRGIPYNDVGNERGNELIVAVGGDRVQQRRPLADRGAGAGPIDPLSPRRPPTPRTHSIHHHQIINGNPSRTHRNATLPIVSIEVYMALVNLSGKVIRFCFGHRARIIRYPCPCRWHFLLERGVGCPPSKLWEKHCLNFVVGQTYP